MEEILKNKKEDHPLHQKFKVHHVLAQSYSVFFFLFLIGVFVDILFPLKIFKNSYMVPLGFVILVFATFLIFWAQHTSRKLPKENEATKEHFCRGPYCYTRTPTHFGLFFLLLGFGVIANASFIILTTFLSLALSKLIFLKKEEKIMLEKYGEAYTEYKKSVRV